jgi:acetyl esterase/lipase
MPELDFSSPLVHPAPAAATAQVHAGLAFAELDGRMLLLDLYAPAGEPPAAGWPAVLLVPGTTDPPRLRGVRGWGQYTGWGRLLAAGGLVAVVAEHRSFEEAAPPRLADEVDAALAWLRANAGRFGVDASRLAVFGTSAGVPLAVRVVAGAADRSLRCAVAYYGYLDLPADAAPVDGLERLSALAQLRGGAWFPPLLVVRAGRDRAELNGTIDAFVAEALNRNLAIELVNYPEGNHAFDIRDDTDESRRIIRRTLRFLEERLHRRE